MAVPSAAPRFMIVSDLDHTMVDHHDPRNISLLRFNALWCTYYSHDSLLVFSTGRSPTLYKELRRQKPLLTPNILIMSVGTEIRYGDSMVPDEGWEQELNKGWNRAIVLEEASRFPQLRFQPETEQRPHKVSFFIEKSHANEVINSLTEKFQIHGLAVKLIYSGGVDLDILPEAAGKGRALAYLLRKLKAEHRLPENTLVCGDSGNDAELFSVPDVYGVMVRNAQEELLHWYNLHARDNPKILHASERCAAGIIQAMQQFCLRPNESPRDQHQLLVEREHEDDQVKVARQIVEFHLLLERWECGEVESSEDVFQSLKNTLDSNCMSVLPWGKEGNALNELEAFKSNYGSQKEGQCQIWVDRIHTRKLMEGKWIVRFDCWKRTVLGPSCRLTTLLLESEERSNRLVWTHIHETWLEGYAS